MPLIKLTVLKVEVNLMVNLCNETIVAIELKVLKSCILYSFVNGQKYRNMSTNLQWAGFIMVYPCPKVAVFYNNVCC